MQNREVVDPRLPAILERIRALASALQTLPGFSVKLRVGAPASDELIASLTSGEKDDDTLPFPTVVEQYAPLFDGLELRWKSTKKSEDPSRRVHRRGGGKPRGRHFPRKAVASRRRAA